MRRCRGSCRDRRSGWKDSGGLGAVLRMERRSNARGLGGGLRLAPRNGRVFRPPRTGKVEGSLREPAKTPESIASKSASRRGFRANRAPVAESGNCFMSSSVRGTCPAGSRQKYPAILSLNCSGCAAPGRAIEPRHGHAA